MNCPRCKTVVTQQDKYCPSCGLPLEAARAGGAAPKKPAGKSKAYEEASTQLVDVDEFRKYMADEKTKGGAPAAPAAPANMAASASLARGGNLAGAAPAGGANLAGGMEENPDMVSTRLATPVRAPAARPEAISPAASRSHSTEVESFPGQQKNNSMLIIGGIALAVVLAGLAYMFMS